jgi:8-oxo-dGTP pyrophosphatase MutT (NUDIX family)
MLDPAFVKTALTRNTVRGIALGELRPAAVLVPLFARDGEDHLLFTRRTELMKHHRGEISFPGGGRHAEDADLLQTALRETEEEMGIRPADITVLGQLDDFVSIAGYRVTPFVGSFPYPYSCRVNAAEIAEVIEAPLSVLRDPAIWRKENWRHRGRVHPVHFYTVGGHEIWGLTAAILRQFLKRIGYI